MANAEGPINSTSFTEKYMTEVDYQKWADLLRNRYGIPNPIDTAEDEDDYDDE